MDRNRVLKTCSPEFEEIIGSMDELLPHHSEKPSNRLIVDSLITKTCFHFSEVWPNSAPRIMGYGQGRSRSSLRLASLGIFYHSCVRKIYSSRIFFKYSNALEAISTLAWNPQKMLLYNTTQLIYLAPMNKNS